MQDLPSGVQFGTLVHAVLEAVDPQAADLRAELRRAAAGRRLARTTGGARPPTSLADALLPTLQTPSGPLADDRRLADIAVTDRLAELAFELPLAGGDRRRALPPSSGHAGWVIWRRCCVGTSRPATCSADYPDRLAHPGLAEQSLRGYLTGSIDAVLRVRDAAGAPRYLVVDYKTNWLGELRRAGAHDWPTTARTGWPAR